MSLPDPSIASGGAPGPTPRRQAADPETLRRHFSTTEGLTSLWIAEPAVELAPVITDALSDRAATGWYGYETRPEQIGDAFWAWMSRRHGWDDSDLHTSVSPSVGTSIGALITLMTEPGDGIILQPPVFTDFKTLITSNGRRPVRNALVLTDDGYRIDLDGLATTAADPANRMLILCNPHNPVGRVWTRAELGEVASICAEHDVFVIADEIHADLAISSPFVPFASVATAAGVRFAATHGPIKTFGLAGVCDTLLITDRPEIAERFGALSSQLHLTRNNVFGLAAFEAAYRHGDRWLDDLLGLVSKNVEALAAELPEQIRLLEPEGTYLAWLDLRSLEIDVGDLARWLATEAGVAVSPGHWFGREGAGFARMTIAAPTDVVAQAAERMADAVARRIG